MMKLEKTTLELGYIPLLDCIAILWAKHQGYFEQQGLDVKLAKEASWASLRDRLAFGLLDAAHCLSAMLPAAASGSDQIGIPLQTPLILSQNRAYISLSQTLCFKFDITTADAKSNAHKIVQAIHAGHHILFSHVFKHSIHHYCLREWLAKADHDLAHQIKFTALPPPYMVQALSQHAIDGFCVGEPWNIQGNICGHSQIIASSQEIIPNVADKVLAVTAEWADEHPNTLRALTQAIQMAQHELKSLQNYAQVWKMLQEYEIIQFECSEHQHVFEYYRIQHIIQNFVENHAQPKAEDFIWLTKQMIKWDNLDANSIHLDHVIQQCIYNL
ncbi:nitrate transporter [Acinetobacter qingfengensis]|uniref:Nitrate transporter n=1 Tax=Acinetobacter qingfengensis TaxID=1262585 RepID=A0A1E7RBQ8_9GAMM|nr:ABC transporter substrate-binding protein [Acinetobacter qingfengensis]KAA8734837.1 nitrate transporter [Acinetobacter qingfengensis]OEY96879.1 nitrate transporter [Acinetobacter qingfengensis]